MKRPFSLLGIPKAYAIAQQSKSVLALRSGFNDILCELSVPQFIIYTRHARRQDRQHDLQPMTALKTFHRPLMKTFLSIIPCMKSWPISKNKF